MTRTSTKQIKANRNNARRSTGPKTAQGKARSSQNSFKHGILSRETLLKNESSSTFEELSQILRQELNPQGVREELLVDKIIAFEWRLKRSWRVEKESLETFLQTAGFDENGAAIQNGVGYAFRMGISGWQENALMKLTRYETSLHNALQRYYSELDRLQSSKRAVRSNNGTNLKQTKRQETSP